MKSRVFLLLLIFSSLFFMEMYADDIEDLKIKKEINRVKKSNLYLYAEAVADSAEEAYNMAQEMLYDEVNEWAAKKRSLQGASNLVINNQQSLWTSLSLKRGKMARVFIYVKKSDILPATNSEMIANKTAIPQLNATVEQIDNNDENFSVEHHYPEAVKALLTCTEYKDFVTKLQQLKSDGQVNSYDRYSRLTNPEDCYLAIYNTEGKMVTILSPGKSRTNVATGQTDGVENYKGCGAIGFTVQ